MIAPVSLIVAALLGERRSATRKIDRARRTAERRVAQEKARA
jgi:hypothetical protein